MDGLTEKDIDRMRNINNLSNEELYEEARRLESMTEKLKAETERIKNINEQKRLEELKRQKEEEERIAREEQVKLEEEKRIKEEARRIKLETQQIKNENAQKKLELLKRKKEETERREKEELERLEKERKLQEEANRKAEEEERKRLEEERQREESIRKYFEQIRKETIERERQEEELQLKKDRWTNKSKSNTNGDTQKVGQLLGGWEQYKDKKIEQDKFNENLERTRFQADVFWNKTQEQESEDWYNEIGDYWYEDIVAQAEIDANLADNRKIADRVNRQIQDEDFLANWLGEEQYEGLDDSIEGMEVVNSFDDEDTNLETELSGLWGAMTEDLIETNENVNRNNQHNKDMKSRVSEELKGLGSNGLKVSSVIGVVNPQLGALAQGVESVGKFAVDTYHKLNDLVNGLNNLSASMQILGLGVADLEGATVLAEDMNTINVLWQDFIFNVKKDLTNLYDGIDNGKELRNALALAFGGLTGGASLIGQSAGGWLSNKILEAVGVNTSVSSGGSDTERNALADVVEKQISNINSQGKVSEEALYKTASQFGNNFIAKRLLTADVNNYTQYYMGLGNMIGNELGLTEEGYLDLYSKLQNFSTSFNNSGLSKYGLGISEEFIYGYANTQGEDFSKLSDSGQIEMASRAFKAYIEASDEERLAMEKLGFEIRNNTSAIQSWQYLETVGGRSSEYVSSTADSFLAVNKNNEDVTDVLFGSKEDRKESIEKIQDAVNSAEKIYSELVKVENKIDYKNNQESINLTGTSVEKVLDTTVSIADSILNKAGFGDTGDRLSKTLNNAKEFAKDSVGGTLGIEIKTNELFDVVVDNKVTNAIYSVTKNSFNRVFN